jgi:hypothetical protein
MCNLIKIEFYPDYMDKIISFHFINDDELKLLNSIKDNKDFLIEKFYRVTKSNYKYLTNKNLEIKNITCEKEKDSINSYLSIFGNSTDLLDLIKSNLDIDPSSEELEISDDDLTDTINISKILEFRLCNNQEEIIKIYNNNPHLKNDDELDELIYSE